MGRETGHREDEGQERVMGPIGRKPGAGGSKDC